ncbi:MAG TPA: PatB family C-S lyase [Prolixibacteraceae bacterium]|nr:PatB family C-S lyase [Prolixibacteraceae bacterium]
MIYNFDEIIDRRNTNCEKYDEREQIFGKADVIPLWVADTDFRTPDFVVDAVVKRAKHEVYGYPIIPDSYFLSISNWMNVRHQWKVDKSWISFSPNVVVGLASAVLSLTEPGDKIIVQPPVYFPFFHVVEGNGRILTENPLKLENGRYYFDFDDLKKKIDKDTKMLILCNPHNPGGRVWQREELEELSKICSENGILVVSDEIHSDIVLHGNKHIPFATVSETASKMSVTVSSASKTFNMAGLSSAYAIIPDKKLRSKYLHFLKATHLSSGNFFGHVATEAAYTDGAEWLSQLIGYLERNNRFIEEFLKENLPRVKPMKPDSTFLVWIDLSELSITPEDAFKKLVEAGVGLSPGGLFGTGGRNFIRLNMGCPLSVLKEGLEKMKMALGDY